MILKPFNTIEITFKIQYIQDELPIPTLDKQLNRNAAT